MPPPTLLDRLVERISPERALARMQARAKLAVLGAWTGGRSNSRGVRGWRPKTGDADADTLDDLPELRVRSRDLARNSPLALGALNTATTSVVGSGLVLRSTPDADRIGWTPEQARTWSRKVEREFALWAGSHNCDATRSQTFYGLQKTAFRSCLESGDVLALLPMVQRPGVPYRTAVQLVEADRLSNPDSGRDTDRLVAGVEKDEYGAPVRYHVASRHPGTRAMGKTTWAAYRAFGERTGRRNVIHLFERLRPDQTRGMPYLAPVIEPIKQLGRYSDAELMAAVIDASFTVFVEQESPDSAPPAVGPGEDVTIDPIKLQNGTVVYTDPGQKVTTHAPNRPATGFDPFVQAILRQVGVALEIPFEVLIKHFTSSYSAARSALLEAWRFFKVRRWWMAENFCQPVYEAWLEEAVALGRIEAPGFFKDPALRAAYVAASWQGDGPGAIDPLREADAAERRIEIGLTTLQDEVAAYDGGDWEARHLQRVREQAARVAGGLVIAQVPAAVPARDQRADESELSSSDAESAAPK